MRILHTSDWHLGRSLFGKKRHAAFQAFLDWLAATLSSEAVDALLVAGDIFDTTTPSNRAQELYYAFLGRIAATPCRHVIVVGGNHDSPSFLDAPKRLLQALHVHVVGSMAEHPGDEILVLRDTQGQPELVVCAVPHLRDRDIRTAEAGESMEDKDRKLQEGIRTHYAAVGALAHSRRAELGPDIPIVATGHLFTAGGQTVTGDGVRDLYVGSLAHVDADMFADAFDYVALGHLHVPQRVGRYEHIRYSGSPLPMGFGEAKQQKSVCLVDFQGRTPTVRMLDVPCFQRLERITGDWDSIAARLGQLAAEKTEILLEIVYDGDAVVGDLRERLEDAVSGTQLEILRIQNSRMVEYALSQGTDDENLEELLPGDVFRRCLDARDIPETQRPELCRTFADVLQSLQEDDAQAQ